MSERTRREVESTRPEYSLRVEEWRLCRDAHEGESAVYGDLERYLPMPSGFMAQTDGGRAMFTAYASRASFPEIVSPTIEGMVGVIHRVEAKIDMPSSMQYLWENCDGRGTPLEALHRRTTEELLTIGRRVILADAPAADDAGRVSGEPYLVTYPGEDLINWDDDSSFFVLCETRSVRDGFEWKLVPQWRVLRVEGDSVVSQLYDQDGKPGTAVQIRPRGGGSLTTIPISVFGARGIGLEPQKPPLLGLARAAMTIFRLDADYKHSLYNVGQETTLFVGIDPEDVPQYLGSGVAVAVPIGGDMKVVGPQGSGIAAQRQAILDERENAAALGARVFETKKAAESGEALRLRQAAETAVLLSVALSSASGLERALRALASLLGEKPDAVVVVPNLTFVDSRMSPQDATELMKLWQAGAISYETLYENLQRGQIASQERTAEEEKDKVDEEGGADLGSFTSGNTPPKKDDAPTDLVNTEDA